MHKGDLAVVGNNNRVEQFINNKFMMSVNRTTHRRHCLSSFGRGQVEEGERQQERGTPSLRNSVQYKVEKM